MKRKIIIPAIIVVVIAILAGIVLSQQNKKYDIPILMYHNLCIDESDVNSETVTASKFESDLIWLKENGYETFLPKEIYKICIEEKQAVPDNAVMITFDDGYLSNYELAYPLLVKYNAKAEISVITKVIDNEEKTFSVFCTWEQLKEMSDSSFVEIGSHSDNMHNPDNSGEMYKDDKNGINRFSEEDAYADLKLSMDKIIKNIGSSPVSFAYPYGMVNRKLKKQITDLFPVNFITKPQPGNVRHNMALLGRFRINQNTDLSTVLK